MIGGRYNWLIVLGLFIFASPYSSSPILPEITNLVKFDSQTMPQRAFGLQLFQQGLGFDNGFAGKTWGVK